MSRIVLVAIGDEDFGFGGNTVVAGEHVDQVVAGKSWNTRRANQVGRDERRRRRRKQNYVHAGELEVEGVSGWSVVVDEGRKAFGAGNETREKVCRRSVGRGGVCALRKTYPDVASQQKNRMLYSAMCDDARPNSQLSGRSVAMQEPDAEPDGNRSEEGD